MYLADFTWIPINLSGAQVNLSGLLWGLGEFGDFM